MEVAVKSGVQQGIRVNREDKPAGLVKEQYRRLTMFHIQYVLSACRETESKARNIRAVMVTALYNSVVHWDLLRKSVPVSPEIKRE